MAGPAGGAGGVSIVPSEALDCARRHSAEELQVASCWTDGAVGGRAFAVGAVGVAEGTGEGGGGVVAEGTGAEAAASGEVVVGVAGEAVGEEGSEAGVAGGGAVEALPGD